MYLPLKTNLIARSFSLSNLSAALLLQKLGLSSLKQQRLIKITLSIFNAVHNSLAPKSIRDLIVHRKNVSYNLRGDYILSLPKPKSTTYGLNSVRYIGPKLWNSIPNMFRNIMNFKSLKRSISQVDLVQLNSSAIKFKKLKMDANGNHFDAMTLSSRDIKSSSHAAFFL